MEKTTFIAGMAVMQKLFSKVLDADVLEFYWSAMQGYDPAVYMEACWDVRDAFVPTTAQPFPVIAVFIQAMRPLQRKLDNARLKAASDALLDAAEAERLAHPTAFDISYQSAMDVLSFTGKPARTEDRLSFAGSPRIEDKREDSERIGFNDDNASLVLWIAPQSEPKETK
jgi:hypothetical protein